MLIKKYYFYKYIKIKDNIKINPSRKLNLTSFANEWNKKATYHYKLNNKKKHSSLNFWRVFCNNNFFKLNTIYELFIKKNESI